MGESYPQRRFRVPPDATEVILVRHGASQAAVPGEPFALIDGHSDPPLATEGREQAERVAERLGAEGVTHLFVTPLQRTQQTAEPIARRTGLEPETIHDLREVLLGEWEGGEYRVRVANGDPLVRRIIEEERWDVIPGSEPMEDFAGRVRAGIGEVLERTGPGNTAVAVVHGGVIGEVCRQATDSRAFAFVHSDNCSISRLVVFRDGRWLLRAFNDTAHL